MDRLRLSIVRRRASALLYSRTASTSQSIISQRYRCVHQQSHDPRAQHHSLSSVDPNHHQATHRSIHQHANNYHLSHQQFSQHPSHKHSHPAIRSHDDAHHQLINMMTEFNTKPEQVTTICRYIFWSVQTGHSSVVINDLTTEPSISDIVTQPLHSSIDVRVSLSAVTLFASIIARKSLKSVTNRQSKSISSWIPLIGSFSYAVSESAASFRWSKDDSKLVVESLFRIYSLMRSTSDYETLASILSQRNDSKLIRMFHAAPGESELRRMIDCYQRLVTATGRAWYLYEAEWLVESMDNGLGRGDLVFTNLLGVRLVVECKHICGRDDGKARSKLAEQTAYYSECWRLKDLDAVSVLSASYTNELELFYTDDVNELIAVESIKRSAQCMLAVKEQWSEQVADATSLGYVNYLKSLLNKHTIGKHDDAMFTI